MSAYSEEPGLPFRGWPGDAVRRDSGSERSDERGLPAVIDYATEGYDADLGTVRMGVRDYHPEIGQFLQPDPLFLESPDKCVGSPVECSLYGYAAGNPVGFVDPSGTHRVSLVKDPFTAILETAFSQSLKYFKGTEDGKTFWAEYEEKRQEPKKLGPMDLFATVPVGIVISEEQIVVEALGAAVAAEVEEEAAAAATHVLPALSDSTRSAMLSSATKQLPGGLTPVGRALQKHASRPGSWLQGLAKSGNNQTNTAAGEATLGDVLKNGSVSTGRIRHSAKLSRVRLADGAGV